MNRTVVILFLLCSLNLSAQVSVQHLRCERLNNPVGIGINKPLFSWEIQSALRNTMQTAYEVIVASTPEKIARNEGDLWESGKINSGESVNIAYSGKPLHSRTACFWRVKVFTNKGESQWSKTASFSIGLLQKQDWSARWIGYDKASPWDSITQYSRLSARYFRKQFKTVNPIKKATVYISGLGLYELYINGHRIGNQVLAPAPTDYRKSVLYNAYDVTAQLKPGDNVLATVLGNGRFFTMRQEYKPKKINTFGFPKMLLQLEIEYASGKKETVVSDGSWKMTADGPIRTNNEYDGEEYDATKELTGWTKTGFNDHSWLPAELVEAPDGMLTAQMNEPMRVMKTIRPVALKKISPEVFILDMGQNMVGWLQLKVKGKRGEKLTLRFAESLQPNGEIYTANLRDAKVTDVYTLKGGPEETWHPVFVFHGFRYVEITGYPGIPVIQHFEGQMVYDGMQTTGSFQSSNAVLNKIYQNAWWGIAGNYKGMPLDCPQRNERQPWLGDRAIGSLGESFLFDNENLYAKWLNDIQQSQTAEGVIPDVAPAFWNYYTDDVTWPATYITVADMLYNQFGDRRSIALHYPSMKKWMTHMQEKYMKDHIIGKDKYGDWCMPPENLELIHARDSSRNTDGALIATAYYYQLLMLMQKFSRILNVDSGGNEYHVLAENIKQAFNNKFYNPQKKYYGNNTVTANLLPFCFGITPDSLKAGVLNNITQKIRLDNGGHISTGLIGSQWIMRTLSNNLRTETAYQMATTKTYPGWGYMAENGATTIWELWNGNTASPQMNSQNHVMLLGDLLTWMYENLAGIKSDASEVAFKKIIMKPIPVDGLHAVTASYQSAHGMIQSAWKNSSERFEWKITIPANTKAILSVPALSEKYVFESGKPVSTVKEIRFIKMEGKTAVFEIGSGNYSFVSAYELKKGILVDEYIFTEASFPESHASTIAETPKGLIAAWFGGTKEGKPDVEIWTSRLVNNQWTKPVSVANGIMTDQLRYACWNPVLYQVPNGELLLFYKIGPRVAGWTGWMKSSKDNGLSWSEAKALPEGLLGPIKNKPVLIGNNLYCASSTEKDGWKVHFEITPDIGKTWTRTADINDGKTISAIQPSILVYPGHRLQILCRSKNRSIMESWSDDDGKTWSPMRPSALPNNNSGTDAVTLRDGTQLIVYNHVKPAEELPNGKGLRTPLNVAVSRDGKKWFGSLVLEDSPVGQYSYPSVIQTKDGLVHIVYTWRREKIKHIVVDPTKLEKKEIVNEKWPGIQLNYDAKPGDD